MLSRHGAWLVYEAPYMGRYSDFRVRVDSIDILTKYNGTDTSVHIGGHELLVDVDIDSVCKMMDTDPDPALSDVVVEQAERIRQLEEELRARET